MANKQVRPVSVDPFAPKAAPIEGLAAVPRSGGEADESILTDARRVAEAFNSFADEAAAVEGKRAGAAAGNDPSFRPSGSATIRGRAHDQAAIETYGQNLDAKLRTSLQETYEANKDNPAALKGALEALHTRMRGEDLFPEIEGRFNQQFTQLSIAYRNKAQSNFESQQQDAGKASLFANLTAIDTQTRRALTTLDPDDPAVEDLVRNGVDRQTALWKKAAGADAVTQASAELKIQGMRNEAWGAHVMARAGKLTTPEDVAAFAKKFETDFAAGKYEGKLDGGGFEVVRANLIKQQKQVMTAGDQAMKTLQASFDDWIKRDTGGFGPPEAEWNTLVAASKAIPDGDRVFAIADGKRKLAAVLRASSVDAGDAIVQRLREELRAGGGADSTKAALVKFGDDFVKEERKAFTSDQLGAAQRKGLIANVTPISFEDFAKDPAGTADALAAQIRDRVAQARAVGGTLARAPQFIRPEEKARLTEIVAEGGDKALTLAAAIVRGSGTDAPAVLKSISDDAPLLAQAGNIMVNGGSLQAARDAFEANRLKAIKGSRVPEPDSATFGKTLRDDLGQAFVLQGEDQGRVRAAATAIAEARLARGGIDPKSSQAGDIYKRAVQEAAGAVFVEGVQFGGVGSYKPGWWSSYKVALPPAVRADSFREVMRNIRDEDLPALGVPATFKSRDLHDAVPVAVRGPNGIGYRFAQGDPNSSDPRYLPDTSGKPFVLDFEAIAPKLRGRIPGAFIGGR